ncbi:O-methyltransferase [Microbulbifer aggregans]|uniref:O-methyltransferase n=1 Tax=Microbulbifer aggregans TaxID=1769779 RepID=UPI001CFDCF90|nr:class I SAM-dependent methyltransferase [Microbulbifer aggregans]
MAWNSTAGLDDARTLAYVRKFGFHEHDVLKKCRLETFKSRPDATMMTPPEEAAFIAFLVKLSGSRNCLEIGSFTGYSSLAIALALPEDGSLTVLEVDGELLEIASNYWQEAGVSNRVRAVNQGGVEGLNALLAEGSAGTFDLVYIDANKESYPDYYESSLALLKTGGVIILDNMLWSGKVADRSDDSDIATTLRQLNTRILEDSRVESILTTLADGVTFAIKR